MVGVTFFLLLGNYGQVSNKSDLCLWVCKQAGSQWSPGSAKQKYIKTTEKGIESAQLKHICPGVVVGGGGIDTKEQQQANRGQYIWEMKSFDHLLINKHIGLHQSMKRLAVFFNVPDSF